LPNPLGEILTTDIRELPLNQFELRCASA
jgi:hypothetical protein